jgi:P2-related tail formation protein
MANIFDTPLIHLLPSAFSDIDEIRWICESVQPEIDEILEIIRNKLFFSSFDKLDELALDYLLFESGIGGSIENSFITSRTDKIKFLKNYVKLNQLRGTKDGILHAVDMLDINAEVTEWFDIPEELEPYWFKLKIISDRVFTDNELKLIRAYVTAYKNTRSWFKTEIKNTYYSDIYPSLVLKRRITFKSRAEFITAIPSSVYSAVISKERIVLKGKFNVN